MYKLVAVAGKLRGEEFPLEDGENTLGRDSGCNIHIPIDGVSKNHLSITVTDDSAYLKDLNSANGTFLNGKMVKQATAKNGDKITLPDVILQIVYVEEKKIIIRKKTDESDDKDAMDQLAGGPMPKEFHRKIGFICKYRLMSFFYNINEEYEWRILFGLILAIFIIATVTMTIIPIQQDSKMMLLRETAQRGAHYADEIARLNFQALEQKNIDQVDTSFLDKEPGVEAYELFDMEGRIVRPIGKLNDIITEPFSVKAKEWALKGSDTKALKTMLADGKIGIAQTITAYSSRLGTFEPVGVIAITFAPKSLATVAIENRSAYLRAMVISIVLAIIFFGIIYYLTVRPMEEMRLQIEDSLRGRRKNLESDIMMSELDPLRNSVNSVLQRVRELQNDEDGGDEFEEMEPDTTYLHILEEFIQGAGGAAMILDSQKNIHKINEPAEDVTGIRETGSQGHNFLDVAREQGFAATVIGLCDNSANENGRFFSDSYELQGKPYNINVTSLLGKDGFPKAYYLTFTQEA